MRSLVCSLRGYSVLALILLVLGPLNSLSASAQDEPETATLQISASACPDRARVGRDLDLSLCQPTPGVTFTVTDENGQFIGSCVSQMQGADARCAVSGVPYHQSISVAEDVSTLPANVESDPFNPDIYYTSSPDYDTNASGEPGLTVSFMNRLIEPDSADTGSGSGPSAEAGSAPTEAPAPAPTNTTASTEAPAPTQTAIPSETLSGGSAPTRVATGDAAENHDSRTAILAGDCDAGTFNDPIAVLTSVCPPAGNARGAAGASAVETSFTTIDVPLEDLLTEGHVLVVFDENDDSVALACGAIGGVVTPDGALAFGLPAVGASRFSGVAYLAEDGDKTHVSVFVAENLNGGATATAK